VPHVTLVGIDDSGGASPLTSNWSEPGGGHQRSPPGFDAKFVAVLDH